jgi:hypothetical protein
MRIIYSFNKSGYEGERWDEEISSASNHHHSFFAFNHGNFINPKRILTAYDLDQLYQTKDAGLMRMYAALKDAIRSFNADALLVNNCPPYHPDFLRTLPVYKSLYSTDDPDSTYKRNIPYLHAYQHVFFADPAYSPDMTMKEKMTYCGVSNADWLPIGVMDFERDTGMNASTLLQQKRDVDLVYVGHCFPQKLPLLTKLKRKFGGRFRIHGFYRLKHNLYINVMHGYGGWIRPISHPGRVALYKRAKIGVNIHWSEYGLGNQRLYMLPANGAMQICDCAPYLDNVYKTGEEIVGFAGFSDLVEKIQHYLNSDDEREAIALRAFERTLRDYRFADITRRAADLMEAGMSGSRSRQDFQSLRSDATAQD